MKCTTAILLLGALLESVAACDPNSCTLTGTLTGTEGCTSYGNYINCLNTQKATCTSADAGNEGLIDVAIATNEVFRALLPCSGSLTSISSMALILSLVVTLMKAHF